MVTLGSLTDGKSHTVTDDGDIHVTGSIDSKTTVVLTSNSGSIIIDGKVDGGSTATLTAAKAIQIGAAGTDADQKKIDGTSFVSALAGGDISVGNKIDQNSHVTLTSTGGSISIGGKIDGGSTVNLTAAGDIVIGEAGNSGDERKIDGNSNVVASAGGTIHLFNRIDGGSVSNSHSTVDFKACRGITIDDKIDGGSVVRLAVHTGTIEIGDRIGGGGTKVSFWPAGSLHVENGIDSNGTATAVDWVNDVNWCKPGPSGYYWRNWPQTFGYVTQERHYPRTLKDLKDILAGSGSPIKAVGGGWSFSDASLPQTTQQAVDATSILRRGAHGTEDLSHVLQGLNGVTNSPMDLQPESVADDLSRNRRFDQPSLTQSTDSGSNLPLASAVSIIDTRGLASSLQSQLSAVLSDVARAATSPGARGTSPSTFYFHVEAGITMTDLDQLLDHQSPRLALQASGGSVGATLAGTISTATHGAEFGWPLLVDRVRAVHLVGPGGQEWWIEGDTSIADVNRLQQAYPGIDKAHFVAGNNGLGGITAQDVLNAVIVSMGTMGVFYSVVLEVVPQFGLQQISIALLEKNTFPLGSTNGWSQLLANAGTSATALRSGDQTANVAVLQHLLDGSKNGTGIPFDPTPPPAPPALGKNVFADLAINPINLDCWITNRRVTPEIPVDSNRPDPDWRPAIDEALGKRASDTVNNSRLLGRVFDFLDWATDVPSANVSDDVNDIQQALRLASFVTTYPDMLVSAVAALNVQAVANAANASNHPDRGHQFLGDALTGFLNAVQGYDPTRDDSEAGRYDRCLLQNLGLWLANKRSSWPGSRDRPPAGNSLHVSSKGYSSTTSWRRR